MARKGLFQKSITLPNGKRKFFYGKSMQELNKKLLEYSIEAEKGKKFKAVASEWEALHYCGIEYNTEKRYRCFVGYAVEEFGEHHMGDITADDINIFMTLMAKNGKTKRTSGGMSSKTLKDQLSVIKMIFKYAKMKKYVSEDVSEYLTPPKGIRAKTREALTDEEIKKVTESTNCTFGLLAYFLLYTGLRKGEALALRGKDIDEENKIINVDKAVYFEGNTPHEKGTKTKSGKRQILCPDKLIELLPKTAPDDILFGKEGRLMKKSEFETGWKHYLRETGLNITAHQLRHTYCTLLYEADIDVKQAQALMGHSDISITQNIYTHLRENKFKLIADKINSLTR